MILWDLCKKLKFEHTIKRHMHNSGSIRVSERHKLLLDLDIETNHLISARRPDLIIINQKKKKITHKIIYFAVPADHRAKLKESEKKDMNIDLARELKKKTCNMKVTFILIVIGAFGTVTEGLLKGLEY